jgi:hypothetical protein
VVGVGLVGDGFIYQKLKKNQKKNPTVTFGFF